MIIFEHQFTDIDNLSEFRTQLDRLAREKGYTPAGSEQTHYRRGNTLKTMTAFNPANLSSELLLKNSEPTEDAENACVALRLNVSTTGQFITAKDQAYWRGEMAQIVSALNRSPVDPSVIVQINSTPKMNAAGYILWVIFGAVLTAVILSAVTKESGAFYIGLVLGGIVTSIIIRLVLGGMKRTQTIQTGAIVQPVIKAGQSGRNLEDIMRRDIRSWGAWMCMMGFLSFFSSHTFSAPWGVIQIILGLCSYLFCTPALYIAYAVTMLWAAFSNLMGGSSTWMVLSLVQIYFTVRIFLQFRRFNHAYLAGGQPAQTNAEPALNQTDIETIQPEPLAGWMSWISLVLGLAGSGGFIASWIVLFLLAHNHAYTTYSNIIAFAIEVTGNLSILAFGIGLGSALSKHRYPVAAIIGMIAGGLGMLLFTGLMILGRLS